MRSMIRIKNFVYIVAICSLFLTAPASAFDLELYGYGLGGYNTYFSEGDETEGTALGISGGLQASDEISFEATVLYDEVVDDEYYFLLIGSRYTFVNADFFMEPSVDFHGGILIPVGEKKDMDGVLGLGAGLMYRTRYNIEFGPRIDTTIVFAGPHIDVMVNWLAVVGYRYK